MSITRIVQQAGNCFFIGLSTDTKPAATLGFEFFEMDTVSFYMGNGTTWIKKLNPDYMPYAVLAAVALSGAYGDLTGRPTIPAAQVSSDWNSIVSPTQILNKPTIPTVSIGSPNTRSLALATAYQATASTKPAIVTVNLTSAAALSLTAGATNTADIVIGATNAVASGTGTVIGKYANSLTGTLVVGLAINTSSGAPITFALPAGWFFAVRQTAGTVTITSGFDQAIG